MLKINLRDLLRSALIGIGIWLGNFLADFLLFLAAVLFFSLPLILSQMISYLLSAFNRYFLIRKIRYANLYRQNDARRFFRFLAISIAITVLSAGLLILLCFGLTIPVAYAKLGVTAGTAWLNGQINRLIFGKETAALKK